MFCDRPREDHVERLGVERQAVAAVLREAHVRRDRYGSFGEYLVQERPIDDGFVDAEELRGTESPGDTDGDQPVSAAEVDHRRAGPLLATTVEEGGDSLGNDFEMLGHPLLTIDHRHGRDRRVLGHPAATGAVAIERVRLEASVSWSQPVPQPFLSSMLT